MELKRDAFAAWLLARRDETVGRVGASDDCPLARYLTHLGAVDVRVGPSCGVGVYLTDTSDADGELLPDWANVFARCIDMRVVGQEVTGADCLEELGS